jgi:hypothetical protein
MEDRIEQRVAIVSSFTPVPEGLDFKHVKAIQSTMSVTTLAMSTARIGSNVQSNWRCSVSRIHTTRLAAMLPVKEIRTTQTLDKFRLSSSVISIFDSCSLCFFCSQMRSCCNLQRGVSGASRDNVSFLMFWTESSTDSNITATVSKLLIYLTIVSVRATYCHCAWHLTVSKFTFVQFITKRFELY